MEVSKDPPTSLVGGHLLRFPLRSAAKSKGAKSATEEQHSASASRRLKVSPNVSKSLNALDLSGKGRSVKDPKGVPDHSKPINSSPSITSANLTPISENRRNRSNPNNYTPMSDASKSSHRRKFSMLSSVSYWLGQIKLSESASKHSISLGFFRLALESGVEPLDRIREELKSYVLRHNLLEELGNTTKDTLHSYNIVDDFEKLQISESRSQSAEDANQNSEELAKNSATVSRARNLVPKFSRTKTLAESNDKEVVQTGTRSITKAATAQPRKKQMSKGKSNNTGLEKNSASDEVDDSVNDSVVNEESKLDDKENTAAESSDCCSSEDVNLKNVADSRWGATYQRRTKPQKD